MFGSPETTSLSISTKITYIMSKCETDQCSFLTPQFNMTGLLVIYSSPERADFSNTTFFSIIRIITDVLYFLCLIS